MNHEKQQNPVIAFRFLGIFLLIQGIIALLPSLVIPGDPKNSFFIGFSIFRWINILLFLAIIVVLSLICLNVNKFAETLFYKFGRLNEKWGNIWFALFLFVVFWVTIWFPATRLPKLQDEIIRVKPFLIFLELLTIELILFFNWKSLTKKCQSLINDFLKSKFKLSMIIVVASIIIIFGSLRLFFSDYSGSMAFLTPGPPIFPLQLLIAIIIFITIFIIEIRHFDKNISNNKWNFLIFFLIWGGTFLLWFLTPFTCYGDRPGPFIPNNICYPPVDDSYLSIGSHYVSLGRGVFNHWFTDKPFYMLFLAIGQWIFGQRIDQYILIQVIVISSVPALLFLLVRKWISKSGAILLAILSAILGMNSIFLYSKLDGANVFIENTELLTGFLLLLVALSLTKHFTKRNDLFFTFVTGCLMGLATLTRMNPFFILPLIIGLFFIQRQFDFRRAIKNTVMCLLGFILVFSPWLFTANDSNGNNFYWIKIEGVLDDRYQKSTSNLIVEEEIVEIPKTASPEISNNPLPDSSPIILSKSTNFGHKIGGLFVYFLNNELQSLAKLPINLTLSAMPVIYNQPVWTKSADVPIWTVDYSFENVVVLFFNLIIIIFGIGYVLRKFGVSGVIPLIIQIGYYFGNGVAQTSGDRYLQPVEWVPLLYFSIGIFAIANFIVTANKSSKKVEIDNSRISESQKPRVTRSIIGKIGLVALLLILGLSLYLTNFIKDKIATTDSGQLFTDAQKTITSNSDLTDFDLNRFLANPNAIIAEGIAYHARYYSSPIFFEQPEVFETTILSENKVLISNWTYEPEMVEISDGSRVILLGCKLNELNFWGGLTTIIKTSALIQIDGEKNLLIAKGEYFDCQ